MFGVGLWRIISLRGGPGMGTQELVVIVVAVALRPGRVQGSEVWEGAEAEADHQVLVAGGCGGDDGGQGQVESKEGPGSHSDVGGDTPGHLGKGQAELCLQMFQGSEGRGQVRGVCEFMAGQPGEIPFLAEVRAPMLTSLAD